SVQKEEKYIVTDPYSGLSQFIHVSQNGNAVRNCCESGKTNWPIRLLTPLLFAVPPRLSIMSYPSSPPRVGRGARVASGQALSGFLNRSAHQLFGGMSSNASGGYQPYYGSNPSGHSPPQPYSPGQGGLSAQLAQVKAVLDRPPNVTSLSEKIRELDRLLSPSNAFHLTPKDLDPLFVLVVGDIFGSQAVQAAKYGRGWHLTTLTKHRQYRDFSAALQFLSSSGGGMMNLIQFLMLDSTCVYDFPVNRLPTTHPLRIKATAHVNGLFSGLNSGSGMDPSQTSVPLSPFEYYFHHFFALISQGSEWLYQSGANLEAESLYPILFEDYLSHFLPIGGADYRFQVSDLVLPHPPTPASLRSQAGTPGSASQGKLSSLLRADFSHSKKSNLNESNELLQSSRSGAELWKSQVFLDTLNQFWLRSYAIPLEPGVDLSPPSDLVKLIRMFIKHLHFFFNGFHPSQSELRDSLQRSIFREVYDSLYIFFDYQFDHWPLDMSFRLILETWLSFVQPWRYKDPNQGEKDGGTFEADQWKHFLVNNGEFFDHLLRKVLLRFFRMDLGCILSSLMVKIAEAQFNLHFRKDQLLSTQNGSSSSAKTSLLSQWLSWVLDSSDGTSREVDEIEKIAQNLEFVSQKLSSVFSVSTDVTDSVNFTGRNSLSQKVHDESELMTPERKWDILNRRYRYNPTYHGHPDEKPLQSDEFHTLARLLYRLSNWINLSLPIGDYYERPGLIGTAFRQISHGPCVYKIRGKHGERSEVQVPARINLRSFAHKRVIFYIVMSYVLALLLGRSATGKILLLMFTAWIACLLWTSLTKEAKL
ncbi:hypothetical protein TCAL_00010, partial [Tigriopus californicus]